MQATKEVVAWYVSTHFRRPGEVGFPAMFTDPSQVGSLAVDADALAAGLDEALFKLLVTMTMFQRRQDQQIMRILRGMDPARAAEISSAQALVSIVDQSPCANIKTNERLLGQCDLHKTGDPPRGACSRSEDCRLHEHTVWLKRYGHFGKMPTSAALVTRDGGGLTAMRERVLRGATSPTAAAIALELELSSIWRVNQKIASMFLSAVSNPDLSDNMAVWSDGLDWSYYVVIDSNVDLFLASVKYTGFTTYDARRAFVIALAREIDLTEHAAVQAFNPRLVQQAMYAFMSSVNRLHSPYDCSKQAPTSCAACPKRLKSRCPLAA